MNKRSWLIGALGLAACARPALHQGPVVVATAPAGAAECPFGGAVVRSGTDDNGNGILDDAEVATRTVVCNDPPAEAPPTTVVRLVVEPAGAHCTLPGTAVQSGPDRNRNGVLDDDEVVHIQYACGEPLLTRLAAAPPDAHCVAGGVAFLAGRDGNHDGRLEDGEIEQREVMCGDELAGDVVLHDASEVAALAGIAVITGGLTIDDTTLGELALPRLVQVRGGIEVKGNAALDRVALPALQSVDGPLTLALDPALTALEVPQLRRVGGLVLDGTGLSELGGLATLPAVLGDIRIANNGALTALDLALGRVSGGLAIDGNPQLSRVGAALPGALGAVHIASNPQLAGVALAGTASARLTAVGSVVIDSNAALGRVALDSDELSGVAILNSPYLTDVAVTGGRVTGDVLVLGNGELRLAFSAPAAEAFTVEGSLQVSGPATTLTSSPPLVVARDCTIDRTYLTAFGPDQVSRVGGDLALRNNPRLTAIATLPVGSLEIVGNHALTELGFQLPAELHGDLSIMNNAILTSAPFALLERVDGAVTVRGNSALKTVFSPSLEVVDGPLSIRDNDSLTELGLAHLRFAGGVQVVACPLVTEVSLPALTFIGFFGVNIANNPAVKHVAFPLVRSGDFFVFNNPVLPTCELTALFAAIGGDHEQSGNDDTAVCTP